MKSALVWPRRFALALTPLLSPAPADAKGCLKGAIGRRRRRPYGPPWRARRDRRLRRSAITWPTKRARKMAEAAAQSAHPTTSPPPAQ